MSDLEELGRGSLLSVPLRQGGELWLESGEFTEPEVAEWLRRNEEELAALPAGRFAAGPLRLDSDNAIRAVTELRRRRQSRHVAAVSDCWCPF